MAELTVITMLKAVENTRCLSAGLANQHKPDRAASRLPREPLLGTDDTPMRSETVLLQFVYNIDQTERDEIAKDCNVAAVDLFDWFSVAGDNSSEEILWEYECA